MLSHETKVLVRVALIQNIRSYLRFRDDPFFRKEIKELIKAYREVCKL